MDPITKAYMSILEESDSSGIVKQTKSQVGKTFGDSESESKVKSTVPNTSDENVDLEDVEESDRELNSDGADGEPKVMKKESKTLNPFDALYNRVLREEGEFNFSTEKICRFHIFIYLIDHMVHLQCDYYMQQYHLYSSVKL